MSIGVIENCYATSWSYGEICVHCNCCGHIDKNPTVVRRARIAYWKERLEHCKNFYDWADDAKTREVQRKNMKLNIKYAKEQIAELRQQKENSGRVT